MGGQIAISIFVKRAGTGERAGMEETSRLEGKMNTDANPTFRDIEWVKNLLEELSMGDK